MEPVRAHGLAPVSWNFGDAAAAVGAPGPAIGGIRVDRVAPCENNRPVVVIKLSGEEKSASEAVILRPVVSVVLVRGDRVPAEAPVLRNVSRQPVVMAE